MESTPLSSSFDTDGGPSFGMTLAAVLVGGFVSGFAASILFGVAPLLPRASWTVLTSVIGAYGVRFGLRMFGYDVGFLAAVCAGVVGSVVNVVLQTAVLGAGGPAVLPLFSVSGVAGLLVNTWIVQQMARSNEGGLL